MSFSSDLVIATVKESENILGQVLDRKTYSTRLDKEDAAVLQHVARQLNSAAALIRQGEGS